MADPKQVAWIINLGVFRASIGRAAAVVARTALAMGISLIALSERSFTFQWVASFWSGRWDTDHPLTAPA